MQAYACRIAYSCSKAATIAALLQGFFISAMVFPYNVAVDFRRPGYAALSPEGSVLRIFHAV